MLSRPLVGLRLRLTSNYATGHTAGLCAQYRHHGHSHGWGCDHGHSHGADGVAMYNQPGEIEAHVQGSNLRACRRVTAVGAATNLTYCCLKIGLGSQGGSVALLADGVHALADFGADFISFASVSATHRRYPKMWFPFGLGRIETLSSLLIACMLISGGCALLFSAVERAARVYGDFKETDEQRSARLAMLAKSHEAHGGQSTCDVPGCGHNHTSDNLPWLLQFMACDHSDDLVLSVTDHRTGTTTLLWSMIAVSTSCVVAKQLLFRWARRVGERAGSRMIVANAYHHRADSWTSAIALVGIAGQTAGLPFLDGVAGALVSSLIIRTGVQLFRGAILELFDFQGKDVRGLADNVREHIAADPALSAKVPNLVALFAVRHGHTYALSGTLLVRRGMSQDLLGAVEAQDTIAAVAKQRGVHLGSTTVTLVEIDAPLEDAALPPTETAAEALRALKQARRRDEAPAGTADADTTPEGRAYHNRRRLIDLLTLMQDFYGPRLIAFDRITVNWAAGTLRLDTLASAEGLTAREQERVEALQADLACAARALRLTVATQ